MFWVFGPKICEILASWLGIEPALPALEGEILPTGLLGKSQPLNHQGSLKVCLSLSGGRLVTKLCPTLVTPWTVACQAPLSMGFSRQEYWSGLPFSGTCLNASFPRKPVLFSHKWCVLFWTFPSEAQEATLDLLYQDESLPAVLDFSYYFFSFEFLQTQSKKKIVHIQSWGGWQTIRNWQLATGGQICWKHSLVSELIFSEFWQHSINAMVYTDRLSGKSWWRLSLYSNKDVVHNITLCLSRKTHWRNFLTLV